MYRFENPDQCHQIPDPLPRQDVQEVPQLPKENLRILCSAVSTCGQILAFADDHKQLTVWSIQGDLLKQYNLVRRANKVIFDKSSSTILVAGDYLANHVIKDLKIRLIWLTLMPRKRPT